MSGPCPDPREVNASAMAHRSAWREMLRGTRGEQVRVVGGGYEKATPRGRHELWAAAAWEAGDVDLPMPGAEREGAFRAFFGDLRAEG